jgi:Uma2 family endonuclease
MVPRRGIVTKVIALMTAEEFERLGPDTWAELVDGVLIERMPGNALHGSVQGEAFALLREYVRPRKLGLVSVEVGFILRRNPDTVRAPDVAFVRAERVPAGGPPESFWEIAPDLVVEVISPSNTAAEVQAKVREWIEAGVRMVWLIYPRSRSVVQVDSLLHRVELQETDTLEGGSVLPGFSCSVAELFG